MSDTPNNILSLGERIKQKKIDTLMDVLISDDVWLLLDSEANDRFLTVEEQRAFMIGAAWSIGYYGYEIERGLKADE